MNKTIHKVRSYEKTIFNYQPALSKKQILKLFQREIFPFEALGQLQRKKIFFDEKTYLHRSGQYILERIMATFCQSITVSGLENIPQNQPCICAYPHKASILDGTLLVSLLLSRGYNSKAVARVSPDNQKQSPRDILFTFLDDFIIPLKQEKEENGKYQQSTYRDSVAFFKRLRGFLTSNGIALIAPEGKSNRFTMGDIQDGFMMIAQTNNAAIVPCTIEYHEPISSRPVEERYGEIFNRIDFVFHKPIMASSGKDVNVIKQKVHNVMVTIASGYICRFKGARYLKSEENKQGTSLTQTTLTQFEEKFNPIYHYVQSLTVSVQRKIELLINLLEDEFQVPFDSICSSMMQEYSKDKKNIPTPMRMLFKVMSLKRRKNYHSLIAFVIGERQK